MWEMYKVESVLVANPVPPQLLEEMLLVRAAPAPVTSPPTIYSQGYATKEALPAIPQASPSLQQLAEAGA